MSRSYERMGPVEFGKHLLETGDLDPVYIAARGAMEGDQQKRWLVAYWCFYDCGVASYLSEQRGAAFADELYVAAQNKEPAPHGGRWGRGKERRHFRGEAAVRATAALITRYQGQMERMVDYVAHADRDPEDGDALAFEAVYQRAREHPMFGPWISFKVADMLERVLGVPVCFDEAAVRIFRDPLIAAGELYQRELLNGELLGITSEPFMIPASPAQLHEVLEWLRLRLLDYAAPPLLDRPLNVQELETILCKWKSHMRGHYPPLNDSIEIRAGLEPWLAHSETARNFLDLLPEVES